MGGSSLLDVENRCMEGRRMGDRAARMLEGHMRGPLYIRWMSLFFKGEIKESLEASAGAG